MSRIPSACLPLVSPTYLISEGAKTSNNMPIFEPTLPTVSRLAFRQMDSHPATLLFPRNQRMRWCNIHYTCPCLLEPDGGAHSLDSFQPGNNFILDEQRYGLHRSLQHSSKHLMKPDEVLFFPFRSTCGTISCATQSLPCSCTISVLKFGEHFRKNQNDKLHSPGCVLAAGLHLDVGTERFLRETPELFGTVA
jgi:hypothetical protein